MVGQTRGNADRRSRTRTWNGCQLRMREHRTGIPITITALCRRKGSNRSLENTCGPIYRKGMEILKRVLADSRREKSFSLSIEGNYGYLEGDDETAAQLYAVVSAATGIVPRAKVAVTGALGLTGEILTVGDQ